MQSCGGQRELDEKLDLEESQCGAVQREGEGEARSGEEGEMLDRAGGSAAVLGLMKRSIASQTVGLRKWDFFVGRGE